MPASTLIGRVRDRLIGPPAPPEDPAAWADRVTADAAADQEHDARAYWDAVRAAAAGTGTAEAAWAAARKAGKTAEEFRADAEQVKQRFEAHAAHAERRPQLEAELARLEAEHLAELKAFERVAQEHAAKCRSLHDRKQAIRHQVQMIGSERQRAFRACPYAWLTAEAEAVGGEIGRLERLACSLVEDIQAAKYQLDKATEAHRRNVRDARNRSEMGPHFEARERELEARRAGVAELEERLAGVHRAAAALRKRREEIEAEQFVP
ncbi:unnamed protein product [Gemmataceae bacterium]|nr:unnamed protein product [Gemmataceae bacterium]VTU02445.1 unnamed protein product [Gemmataceae bacterium]